MTFAMLRCTNSSPGRRPTISLAGTRLSAQPIQRYLGLCCRESLSKKSGSIRRMRSDQTRLFSKRCESERIGEHVFRWDSTFQPSQPLIGGKIFFFYFNVTGEGEQTQAHS